MHLKKEYLSWIKLTFPLDMNAAKVTKVFYLSVSWSFDNYLFLNVSILTLTFPAVKLQHRSRHRTKTYECNICWKVSQADLFRNKIYLTFQNVNFIQLWSVSGPDNTWALLGKNPRHEKHLIELNFKIWKTFHRVVL